MITPVLTRLDIFSSVGPCRRIERLYKIGVRYVIGLHSRDGVDICILIMHHFLRANPLARTDQM